MVHFCSQRRKIRVEIDMVQQKTDEPKFVCFDDFCF